MEPFLILGRPRSRTAWVANLLTAPPASFCLHEGLADAGADFPRLKERMALLRVSVVGNADTGLIHHLDAMLSAFPNAKLVLMTGNDASWRNWATRFGLPSAVRAKVDEDYARALDRLRGQALLVDCRSLTVDIREAKRLWAHCVPNIPFDSQRWEVLKDLNIQVIPESLSRRLRWAAQQLPQ